MEQHRTCPLDGATTLGRLQYTDDGWWEFIETERFENSGEGALSEEQMDEETELVVSHMLRSLLNNPSDGSDEDEGPPPAKRSRRPKKVATFVDDDGERQPLRPHMTLWYNNYIAHPDLNCPRFQKKFRKRFRMPHAQFVELAQAMEESEIFDRWKDGKKDACGVRAAPLPLLLLCALRYLGCGWTFDDLQENTGISEDVIRVFFHCFIEYGSTVLYEKYVKAPVTAEEAIDHMYEFAKAGFPGAVGSTDATHIMLKKVQYRFRQAHLGFKMSHTARTYNITVNHRRRILASTHGHPSRWNDKTLALFDDFMRSIYEGSVMADIVFELYDYDEDGNVIKTKYRGVWLLVDNGYLAWATTVPPIKTTTNRAEIRFSAWLESMRKDVECTFGILKGRFRILKTGIRLHGIEAADKIWLTCCALHNWLLEVDGLDEKWDQGVQSDWEGPLGEHDAYYVDKYVPEAIRRLHSPTSSRQFDVSGLGSGEDRVASDEDDGQQGGNEEQQEDNLDNNESQEDIKTVRKLSLNQFRAKLVRHFDIAFKRREIEWPSRTGRSQPNVL